MSGAAARGARLLGAHSAMTLAPTALGTTNGSAGVGIVGNGQSRFTIGRGLR